MPRLASTLLLGFSLIASAASAQDAPPTDERVAQARAAFEQADADLGAQRFIPAAEGFRRALELLREAGRSSAPLVWYNVASAYDRGGRPEEALDAYRHFVDEAVAETDDTRRLVVTARERIAALSTPATPAVEDEPVEDEPSTAVSVEPTAAPTESSGGGISPIGPIVLGVGGAMLVSGLVIGGVALAADGDFGSSCPTREACDPSLRAQWDEARTFALAGDVLWIAGAAVAAVGLVLTLVLVDEGSSETAALSCGPMGCSVRGSF